MGLPLIALCVGAAIATNGTGFFVPALLNAGLSVWGNGVLLNFSREEAQQAPNWAAGMSMLTTIAGVVLLIIGLSSK